MRGLQSVASSSRRYEALLLLSPVGRQGAVSGRRVGLLPGGPGRRLGAQGQVGEEAEDLHLVRGVQHPAELARPGADPLQWQVASEETQTDWQRQAEQQGR